MRDARLQHSRDLLAAYVSDQGVHPDDDAGQRLIALLLLVSGSLGLVELHDRQGLGVDDAVDASLWATRALIDATRNADGHRSPARTPCTARNESRDDEQRTEP